MMRAEATVRSGGLGASVPPRTRQPVGSGARIGYSHARISVKLHRTIFNEIRPYRSWEKHARVCKLPRDDPGRRAYLGAAEDKAWLQFFTGTPMPRYSYTAPEFHSSAQNSLRLP